MLKCLGPTYLSISGVAGWLSGNCWLVLSSQTHPTRTALSSVDIHTYFCYQRMLPESVAVSPNRISVYVEFRSRRYRSKILNDSELF